MTCCASCRWATGLAPQAYQTSYDLSLWGATMIVNALWSRISSRREKEVVLTLPNFPREAFAAVVEAHHVPIKQNKFAGCRCNPFGHAMAMFVGV